MRDSIWNGAQAAVRLAKGAGLREAMFDVADPAVWIALDDGERVFTRLVHAPGDRDQVERWTEQAALDLLRRRLSDLPLE